MRWLIAATCLGVVTSPRTSAAQRESPAPRFFFAVGPTWTPNLSGFRLRAEYHLTRPDRAVSLRAEAGGRWTPTHAFSRPTLLYGEGSTYQGWGQSADLTLGVAATVTPWPRAAFSPYLVTGVAAVQSWNHGHSYYQEADGSLATPLRPYSGTLGEFAPILGLGLRVRLGNRYLRLEARQWAGSLMRELTLGTALRF